MTKEQFNEIKERLSKWREERHLTYENQMEGFLGNVFEEVSEYFRAKDDLERVDALCDIAVLMINSFEFLEYVSFDLIEKKVDIFQIIEHFTGYFIEYRDKIEYYNEYKEFEYLMIVEIECLVNSFGFDFYKCMIETIKEIESRTGYYDDDLNKFIKDEGAYNKEDLLEKYPISKYSISEDNTHFIIFDKKGHTEAFIKKWYKADYESCRIKD
ncbi:TPA: hypothetical protein R5B02_001600 [Campylobacter jejuni]|nr:hypothetical protein [Campylobacter jejuni]